MKRSGKLGLCGVLLLGAWAAWGAPGAATVMTTHMVFGREYIPLPELLAVFDLKAQALPARNFMLLSPRARVSFCLDSREAEVQGVKYWLNAPPAVQGGQVWFPAIDVVKMLDPLLRHSGLTATGPLRTIVLDPGHGGEDQGTHARNGVSEKQLTVDVARRLEALLVEDGYRVLLTRRDDRFIPLDARSAFARANHADLFVSVHFNSAQPATEPCGAETFLLTPPGALSTSDKNKMPGRGDYVSLTGNRLDNDNVLLAHYVQRAMVEKAGATERGVKRARFKVLEDVTCPAVLVECGFLSNPTESRHIGQAAYRQQLAAAIATGIESYRAATRR